jgi:hypothetical protein
MVPRHLLCRSLHATLNRTTRLQSSKPPETPLPPPPPQFTCLASLDTVDWSTISPFPPSLPIVQPTTSILERTPINRSTKRHLNIIPLSAAEQFRHNLFSLIRSTLMSGEFDFTKPKEVCLHAPWQELVWLRQNLNYIPPCSLVLR